MLDRELEAAKQQLRLKNHHAARLALAKKKYQEQLLQKTGEQLLNIEQMTSAIEYALVEKDILEGLKQGNAVLADIHKEMNLESVQKLMDDTADAIQYQNEISEMLSEKLTADDEADIMAQLELLAEQEQSELVKVLPNVPKSDAIDASAQESDPSSKQKTKNKKDSKLNKPIAA